jgi:hypothetical protein
VSDGSNRIYYPCGLIANSMFSDKWSGLQSQDGKAYSFPPKWIAWPSDVNRYGPTKYEISQVAAPPYWRLNNPELVNPDGTYRELPDLQHDERFQAWMRVSALPTFRKPYGRMNSDLPAGQYTMVIDSNFEVASYGATKSVVLSTTSWMGGNNPFLGLAYIITGVILLVVAVIFLAKHLIRPRQLGDLSYLSWNNPPD